MQISFSTKSIYGLSRIGTDPDSVLDRDAYGLTLDAETFYSRKSLECHGTREFYGDAIKDRFAKLIQDCAKGQVRIHAMRAPRLKWETKRTDLNGLMLQIGKDCIRACAGTGCEYIVIQPLFAGIPKVDLWRENHHYYAVLGQLAKQAGMKILMENQCGYANGRLARGICADFAAAAGWIDELNGELEEEVFGFCLDTCACSLCRQDMGVVASELGTRLKAVLIRECDGLREASRIPFTGKNVAGHPMDWQGLIRGLRRIEFDGILIMDGGDTMQGLSHLLRPYAYPLMRSVADYLKWQIGMERCIKGYPARVLFGAGNMCRQYMACYGEQYPPLFISDNNASLWGTRAYGVEIKPPEELKDLPKGCVVIICNTYYEEIVGQLKSIGVKRIGAFSDEYL